MPEVYQSLVFNEVLRKFSAEFRESTSSKVATAGVIIEAASLLMLPTRQIYARESLQLITNYNRSLATINLFDCAPYSKAYISGCSITVYSWDVSNRCEICNCKIPWTVSGNFYEVCHLSDCRQQVDRFLCKIQSKIYLL